MKTKLFFYAIVLLLSLDGSAQNALPEFKFELPKIPTTTLPGDFSKSLKLDTIPRARIIKTDIDGCRNEKLQLIIISPLDKSEFFAVNDTILSRQEIERRNEIDMWKMHFYFKGLSYVKEHEKKPEAGPRKQKK
ncbi:hypothetical protein [Flavobacterium silvaticum]|uniref:Uncharacterized protein n=1 Tax=Flavobacterium silvaticum TaxID=1852020 RepID=A0A972G1H1_9FLAO|nr:hypothetical protein [Flavobacterium silvaticum]NMH28716.1 hypothetical protein [Flavobacterium silvaticum]